MNYVNHLFHKAKNVLLSNLLVWNKYSHILPWIDMLTILSSIVIYIDLCSEISRPSCMYFTRWLIHMNLYNLICKILYDFCKQ